MNLLDLIAAYVAQHGYLCGSPYLQKTAGVTDYAARKALSAYLKAHPETPPHPSTAPDRRHTVQTAPQVREVQPSVLVIEESGIYGMEINAPEQPAPRVQWEEDPDAQTATVEIPAGGVRTLDELLAVAQVDLETWKVDRFLVNQWNAAQRGLNGEPVVTPLWQVKAWLKKRQEAEDLRALRADTLAAIAQHAPQYAPVMRATEPGKHILILSPSDAHIGKGAWAAETGADMGIPDAVQAVRSAVDDLTASALPLGLAEIVLVIGNDFLQTDSSAGTTTKGTHVETAGRYRQAFGAARDLVIECVERLTRYAPVHLVFVPGNHDFNTTFHLGDVMAAWFRNAPDVTVDASPTPRKYLSRGRVLLGLTHGDSERHAALPQIMAQERPRDWAGAACREWLTGHYHRKAEKHYAPLVEGGGVIVRTLPALTKADFWHVQHGYLGTPAAQALVYCPERGLRATFHYHPEAI